MEGALTLARWLSGHHPEPINHLKLQKLAFYGYGAALAFGQHPELGPITFEAWEHGPVNRQIWVEYRDFGREPLPQPTVLPNYSAGLTQTLHDVLAVYGSMSAIALRNECPGKLPGSTPNGKAGWVPSSTRRLCAPTSQTSSARGQ